MKIGLLVDRSDGKGGSNVVGGKGDNLINNPCLVMPKLINNNIFRYHKVRTLADISLGSIKSRVG